MAQLPHVLHLHPVLIRSLVFPPAEQTSTGQAERNRWRDTCCATRLCSSAAGLGALWESGNDSHWEGWGMALLLTLHGAGEVQPPLALQGFACRSHMDFSCN